MKNKKKKSNGKVIAALLIEQIDTKYMYTFKTSHISFESDEEIPWTLDGEFGGTHYEVEIHNCNKQLQIIVPEKYLSSLSEQKKDLEEEEEEK